jgi:AcrR family transcriptional regulator
MGRTVANTLAKHERSLALRIKNASDHSRLSTASESRGFAVPEPTGPQRPGAGPQQEKDRVEATEPGRTGGPGRPGAADRARRGETAHYGSSAPREATTTPPADARRAPGPAGDAPATGAAATAAAPDGGDGASGGTGARPRRRQARGERRITQLLEAAASVFCTTGYTAASTNAIAREAGVSPGTLYQYFPNKEAIAVELGSRLLERWRASHGTALANADQDLPLDQLLNSILDPLFTFNYENPAFAVLIHGPDAPGRIAEEFATVHGELLGRIEELLAAHLPAAPPAELARVARTSFAILKAGLDLVIAHEGEEREKYATEVKLAMFRYLEPVFTAWDPECPWALRASGGAG